MCCWIQKDWKRSSGDESERTDCSFFVAAGSRDFLLQRGLRFNSCNLSTVELRITSTDPSCSVFTARPNVCVCVYLALCNRKLKGKKKKQKQHVGSILVLHLKNLDY